MDSKGFNTPMGPNGSYCKLKYLIGMGYEGKIASRFTFVHKGILVVTQNCARVSEQGL